jgi:hypothetical protein
MEEMKKDIRTEWETTDMGELTKIVGIEITQSPGWISISQKQSIQNILERQGLTEASPVQMPLNLNIKIVPNPDGNEGNWSNAFAQLLGELQFIVNVTCPNIAFSVNRLTSYTANPSMQHQTALKRILWYLSGTRMHGITYKQVPEPIIFKGFANAAYQNRDNGKLTTGYVFITTEGAITWQLGRQSIMASSSTEAEYIALWEAGKEASWLRNLYRELGYPQQQPTTLMENNEGAYLIAKNPIFHKRTKHIDSKFHWVREKVAAGRFDPELCCTEDQTTDVLTKALPCPKHEKHAHEMGLLTVWRGVLGNKAWGMVSRIT